MREQTGIRPEELCLTPQYLRTPIDITPGSGASGHEAGAPIADVRFAFYLTRTPSTEAAWQPAAAGAFGELAAKAAGLDGQAVPLNASALIYNSRGEYLLHLRGGRWRQGGSWRLIDAGGFPGRGRGGGGACVRRPGGGAGR
ncbi:hypothetical protein ACIO7M_31795 [Streptomyces toxytricini]|uniref:Uncharacterized protein n=1 Tax=Streptomyces toxytricini TaxID=67369 RepID=A0ABW8EQX7_STRT5